MTYEQFVAKMKEHEGRIGLDPDNEMKEVFRWATQNHFDHFWRYTTEPKSPDQYYTLEEMVRLEHTLLLKGATLYGDPNPAPYDAAYRWENEEGEAVAALVVNHEHLELRVRVPGHVYTRHVRDEDEMGQTINFFVNTSARYGGSKSLGSFRFT